MRKLVVEAVGWYGVVAILLAYTLVSFGAVEADSVVYQVLNLTGAVSIAIISLVKRAYQPATLNIIWAIIALIAILRMILG